MLLTIATMVALATASNALAGCSRARFDLDMDARVQD